MEFKSLTNIESSFRRIRLMLAVFTGCCALVTGYALWSSYRFAERQREKIYVLDGGKSLMMALSQDLSQNRPAEAREHVRRFHELFFSLSPQKDAIGHNINRALQLADKSAYHYYVDFAEKGYYNRLISGNINQVVYVDSVFVLNALMDYLLVLCAARLAGIPLRRRRYLLAGLLGGAYAVAVFLPGLGFLSATPVKLAAGILLALAAYGGEAKLLRLTLLLFAVSCAMAGCVLALGLVAGGGVPMVNGVFYTDVDAKVLLTAAAAAYLVLTVVFRAAAGKGVRGELVRAQVCLAGRTTAFTAFCDTGNALRDPVSGAPVLVVSPGRLDGALPREVRSLLDLSLIHI